MSRAVDNLVDTRVQHLRAAERRVVAIEPAGEEGDVQAQLPRRTQYVEPRSRAVRLHNSDTFHFHTSVLSVEVQVARTSPLQLEEVWVGGQCPGAVENACRLFASRDGRQHRPEESDAIDVDGRGTEIRAD